MSKKISPILAISLLSAILLSVLVSAYSFGWGGGYYSSPEMLLENPWIRFGLIMGLFFALIFFALSKTFKSNMGAGIVISLVLSFAIAGVFSREWSFMAGNFREWIFLVVGLIAIFSFAKIGYDLIGPSGAPLAITISMLILNSIDLERYLPYEVADSFFGMIIYALSSWFGIIIFAVITVAVMMRYGFSKRQYDDDGFYISNRRRHH